MTFTVRLSKAAEKDLDGITDRRSYQAVERKIEELQTEPEKRGKPLINELKGYYSARAAGQRYRVIYRVERSAAVVTVVVIGIRKAVDKQDAYVKAQKRLGKK